MSQASRPVEPGGLSPVGFVETRLDRESFGMRFSGSHRKLWWVAVSVLGRREQADDVLQEAAVIALGKLHEFDASTSFDAWMAQIVRFVALNASRKRYRRAAHHEQHPAETHAAVVEHVSPISATGMLGADRGTFDDRVLAALMGLPEQARVCLLLRVLEELSYREISEMLAIPEGTAMSHVHRSRASMRRELEREEAP